MKLGAWLALATLGLLGSSRAEAAEAPPPPPGGRFCAMVTPTYLAMKVFDVPVRWFDLPLGIGGCYDDGSFGFEWYGTVSTGIGRTRAGRDASMTSLFGSRMVFRVEMVRLFMGFRAVGMSFDPAPGLIAGEGLSQTVGMGELGLGVDLLRIFAKDKTRVRATITLDVSRQSFGAFDNGPNWAFALGAHL